MGNNWFSEIKKEADSILSKMESNKDYDLTEEESNLIETYYLYEESQMI